MGIHLNPLWYQRLPVVSERIDCGGLPHRITWRDGSLVLEDHDPLAEQSLTALGAKPPMCLQLLEAWRARPDYELLPELLLGDGRISPEELALRREAHETEMERARRMPQRTMAHLGSRPGRADRLRVVERQARERLEGEEETWAATVLEVLPPRLRRALALSIIVNLERHWDDDVFRGALERHLEPALATLASPLFERSADRWSRNLTPYRELVAETGLLAPGRQPTCAMWVDGRLVRVALSLPLSWFTDVWARGITLVDGCFVMAVEEGSADGMTLHVVAIRLERRHSTTSSFLEAPALVTGTPGGVWRLEWE